ncbi:hypothetical protein BKA70DRAFT_180 [Coprinopsis sp. MPI-PUGE-AT-0042]|nr:hypothetical protein BKA70DRAFT_180 [Coprinopsis sp. MPI-PUGE-AT-0042]
MTGMIPQRPDVNSQWVHDKYPGVGRQQRGRPPHQGSTTAGSAAATESMPAGVSNRLKISNLHYEVTPQDLSSIFGQIGTLVREPLLWYDGSGRSTGTAVVTFETAAEATRAKNQFDGILAKGQPMEISYQITPRPRRTTSAPSTLSLLSRIEKPPLLERLAKDDTATVSNKKTNAKNQRGEGGRIGPIRAKTTRASKPKHPKKPKTAADLDKELDAFMVDVSDPAAAAPSTATAGAPAAATDVDMA